MTTTRRYTGRDIIPGDAITFCPGNKPIRIARIDPEQFTHATLGMTYRIAYDVADRGFVLFDDQRVQLIDRLGELAS